MRNKNFDSPRHNPGHNPYKFISSTRRGVSRHYQASFSSRLLIMVLKLHGSARTPHKRDPKYAKQTQFFFLRPYTKR